MPNDLRNVGHTVVKRGGYDLAPQSTSYQTYQNQIMHREKSRS